MKGPAVRWFTAMVIFAIASFISFIQINSYWADTHNFNGFIGWLGVGLVLAVAAIFCLYNVAKKTNKGGKDAGGNL